jgi:Ca-activated chloride channel homolog
MKYFHYLRSITALTLLFLFANYSEAQTPAKTPPPTDDGEVIKVNSRLVVVPVSVTSAAGDPVLGLGINDFRISEENKPQVIEAVGNAENVPLEIALLIDVSGSVNPLFELEKNAAAQFLQTVMKPEDKATIMLIGAEPTAGLERGNSSEAAQRLRTVVAGGRATPTAFYDTVAAATRYLRQNAPERSRRVILAITDGEDNYSNMVREAERATYRDVDVSSLTQEKRDQLAAATDGAHRTAQDKIAHSLQDADTVFYVVNPSGSSVKLNKISTRAHTAMERFSNETGGTPFLPNFQPTDTKNAATNASNDRKNIAILDKIFKQLANELRAQYLIQYYSESEFPADKYVKLAVTLKNPATGSLKARQGYYSKKQN